MDITVIGGGITGLTTALALNKTGRSSQVYEKASQLNEVGAGIWMQPNAMKILDWLNIGDKVRQDGMQMNAAEITNHNLKPIRNSNRKFITDETGNKITAIHRARLQKILFESLPSGNVHLGKEYQDHQVQSNSRTMVYFGDGSTIETEMMLGADGINSRVREKLNIESSTRYSGQTCWRGISNIDLPAQYKTCGIEAWGNNIRFGFSSISKNEAYWFAVVRSERNLKDIQEDIHLTLGQIFGYFHPLILEIIKNTPRKKIIRNDINDLRRLEKWSFDNICLLGDAAHATTPNMGQGACQGIEDAFYIAQSLQRHSEYSTAFVEFERSRRSKVDYVVNTSWRMGKMIHNPLGRNLLKVVLKLTPERALAGQMNKLFEIKILT